MSTRRSAFDPSRLDDELAELLPPPAFAAAGTSTTAPGVTAGAQPPAGAAVGEDGTHRPIGSAASTARPASPGAGLAVVVPAGDGVTTVVAVRVPRALYESVVRDLLGALVEKPSYAQIIAWTCQDHPDEVRLELQRQVTADSRAPEPVKLYETAVRTIYWVELA